MKKLLLDNLTAKTLIVCVVLSFGISTNLHATPIDEKYLALKESRDKDRFDLESEMRVESVGGASFANPTPVSCEETHWVRKALTKNGALLRFALDYKEKRSRYEIDFKSYEVLKTSPPPADISNGDKIAPDDPLEIARGKINSDVDHLNRAVKMLLIFNRKIVVGPDFDKASSHAKADRIADVILSQEFNEVDRDFKVISECQSFSCPKRQGPWKFFQTGAFSGVCFREWGPAAHGVQ